MPLSSVGSTITVGGSGLIGEITDISMSGVTCAEIETSNLSKTVKSFVLGTQDGGTVSVVANFTATPDMPVAGDNSPSAVILTFSSGSTVVVTFNAFVQSMSIETGIDAVISVTYVLQVTGAVTVT